MNRKVEYILRIIFNFFRLNLLKLVYGKKIIFSNKLLISPKADIHITNNGSISIGSMCNVEKNTQLRSTGGSIILGKNVYLNRNCNIVSHKNVTIGSNVTIGPNVCIYDHDHNYKKQGNDKYVSKKIVIGSGTWIGANCIITKGVNIGENSVIAAGTIVTKNVPSNSIIYSDCKYVVKGIKRLL